MEAAIAINSVKSLGCLFGRLKAVHHDRIVKDFAFSDVSFTVSDSSTIVRGHLHLDLRTFLAASVLYIAVSTTASGDLKAPQAPMVLAREIIWTPTERGKPLINPKFARDITFEIEITQITRGTLQAGSKAVALTGVVERPAETSGSVTAEHQILLRLDIEGPPAYVRTDYLPVLA